MLGLLQVLQDLVVGLLQIAWWLVALLLGTAYGLVHHLHVNAPHLEGLLLGVALTWLLLRRDRHALIRIVSAPLKLVLDILDLAWDQCVEVVKDGWDVVAAWAQGSYGWSRRQASNAYSWLMDKLRAMKERLVG